MKSRARLPESLTHVMHSCGYEPVLQLSEDGRIKERYIDEKKEDEGHIAEQLVRNTGTPLRQKHHVNHQERNGRERDLPSSPSQKNAKHCEHRTYESSGPDHWSSAIVRNEICISPSGPLLLSILLLAFADNRVRPKAGDDECHDGDKDADDEHPNRAE